MSRVVSHIYPTSLYLSALCEVVKKGKVAMQIRSEGTFFSFVITVFSRKYCNSAEVLKDLTFKESRQCPV